MGIYKIIIVTEITKDLIKFVAEVIILLLIFSVVFDPEGAFLSDIFNFLSFAEPLLLQNHIATAIEVASDIEGEFITEITTTGRAYAVEVYTSDKIYISVTPDEEELLNTKFYNLEPTVVKTDCYVPRRRILLEEGIRSRIYVIKKIVEGICEIYISPGPDISELTYMEDSDVDFFEGEDVE